MRRTSTWRPPEITERQRQVVELIAAGCSNGGGRRPPRHLDPHGQGARRRPPAEARRAETAPDPTGVPRADRPRIRSREASDRKRRLRGTDGPVPAPPRPGRAGGHGSSPSRRQEGDDDTVCAVDLRRPPTRGEGAGWRRRRSSTHRSTRRHIIERPRLLKLLDETEAKIILLVAPAGYGKTTLARQWLRKRPEPRVWVRARDALSGVGLAAGIAQGISADGDVGRRLRQRMRADGPQLDARGAALLLADDLGDRVTGMTLVVDDIHTIAGAQAEPVVDHLADMGSVVLATARDLPSFATARRIVYGDIAVIGNAANGRKRDPGCPRGIERRGSNSSCRFGRRLAGARRIGGGSWCRTPP